MKLLLDTHIWLWSLLERPRLTARVAAALTDPGNELWLSPISTWELVMLVERRRVVLDAEPETWVRRVLSEVNFREAPLTHEVAIRTRRVRPPHGDPADALLAATAAVYDLTLVTADHQLLRSKSYAVLANR
ncbi:MAG TPA: type II toxin-antitoxin system VapC family toxin [Methylomirabilota bacterium]|jgi:PIN domain nuclease of toxin-antitoxin system|nr:type II toxin-antitoxin system VapC family toxin [Methylomirabilota bacterium]